MRILTTGSRDWAGIFAETEIGVVLMSVEALSIVLRSPLVIVHGGCPTGADAIVDRWARRRDYEPEVYEANWSFGKAAGPLRNRVMVYKGADLCVGFLKNNSRGTLDCLRKARAFGIPTFEVGWKKDWEEGNDVAEGY